MNKKDLSAFRRQLKVDSYQLELKQFYMAYVKKDNRQIMYAEGCSFDRKPESEKEIYLGGFKKLLTGSFNAKLFELGFADGAQEGEGRELLQGLLHSEGAEFDARCGEYIARSAGFFSDDADSVVAFAVGHYKKPTGRKSRRGEEESLDGFDDVTYGVKFLLCSICKADEVKKGLYYSAETERFEITASLDKTVAFLNPAEGFMYPSLGDGASDVNKLLYYTAKANFRNDGLLETVLRCVTEPTVKEEQEKFGEILRLVSGQKVRPEIVKNIFDAVSEKIEAYSDSEDEVTLAADELRDIFQESGIEDVSSFDEAYSATAEEGYEFKAASLVSGAANAVKIISGVAEVTVDRANLGAVRQVINARGRKCLQIELAEDAELNGIALETENT